MNNIASKDERVMRALNETLNLEQYPDKVRNLSDEMYCICLYADDTEAQNSLKDIQHLRLSVFMVTL